MPVRVGVIGVGVMGAEHARLLTHDVPGAAVAAVFDVVASRAELVAAACAARAMDDPMVLIKDTGVDAVLVASSDPTHEEFVLAAVAAGKPVLCEKPLAPELAGCRRILDAELEAGRRLVSVGFMRRFDPGYRQLRSTLTAGRIGAPLLLHCVHRNVAALSGQQAEAAITGSAVHEMDVTRWLLGEEITEVSVHRPRSSRLAGGAQDPIVVLLRSANGVLVDVEVFLNAGYGYDVRCELVGETGAVTLDAPPATVLRSSGQEGRGVPADWRPRFAEAYRLELSDWVAAVAAGRPSAAASTWDGYLATAAAEAGVRALHSGNTEHVDVPEPPAMYR